MGKIILCKFTLLSLLFTPSCSRSNGSENSDYQLRKAEEFSHYTSKMKLFIKELTKSPHPFGSPRQLQLAEWINKTLSLEKLVTRIQPFKSLTPNPLAYNTSLPSSLTVEKDGYNVISVWSPPNPRECAVIIGSHYDSKHLTNAEYVGANDSGSSSALLMSQMIFLKSQKPGSWNENLCHIIAVWFDGEESILEHWNEGLGKHPAKIQDNTYGSRFFVENLSLCADGTKRCFKKDEKSLPIKGLILMDMVGSKNLSIALEQNSSPNLLNQLKKTANDLRLSKLIGPKISVEDDHIPFLKTGIQSIDLIDFTNRTHWHQPSDLPKHLSYSSMHKAGKIALLLAFRLSKDES